MELGQIVGGKYRFLRLLGDGGMGAVYEASHEVLGSKVAIKVLHQDLAQKPEIVDRFLREARVLAQIQSPHVVRVLDVAMGDGAHPAYIVMELLQGESLSAVLKRERRLSLDTSVAYASQVLEALSAAHGLGVVHRDLKPENIIVTKEGDRTVLKVIDFGIAKASSLSGVSSNLTVMGALMGTPEYMAPEQAHSAERADARSDLYAVGVLLYEMISGTKPVEGDDPRVIAMKVERGDAYPLIRRMPDVPRELAGLVHRAMAARPELRFASAHDMKTALESAIGRSRASVAPTAASPRALEVRMPSGPPASALPEVSRGAATVVGGGPDRGSFAPPVVSSGVTDPGHGGPHATARDAGGFAPPAPAWTPPAAVTPAGRGRRRGAGGTVWLLGGMGVLVLGGIAVAFVFAGSSKPTPVATKAGPVAIEPTDSASSTPATEVTMDPALPPLPVPSNAVASHPIVSPPPHGSGVPSAMPGTAQMPPTPFGLPPFTLPPGLPSAFPNPFPNPASSGVGPVMTFPTAFPGFGFPPDPGGGPAPSAAPSGGKKK